MSVQYVTDVDVVHVVECVKHVHGLKNIFNPGDTSNKSYDYQEGGKLYIEPKQGLFQATIILDQDCDLKSVAYSLSAYDLEDTIDIIVGEILLAKNIPTLEMADVVYLEKYTSVPAGTPIILQFRNNSAKEKYIFYRFNVLVNKLETIENEDFNWYESWNGYHINMPFNGDYELSFPTPPYFNVRSRINKVDMIVKDLVTTQQRIARITWNNNNPSTVISDYIEHNPLYVPYAPFARSGNIIISTVRVYNDYVYIKFHQVKGSTGSVWDATGRINMQINLSVTNRIY